MINWYQQRDRLTLFIFIFIIWSNSCHFFKQEKGSELNMSFDGLLIETDLTTSGFYVLERFGIKQRADVFRAVVTLSIFSRI